jgi:large subunit ribosomal protein L25
MVNRLKVEERVETTQSGLKELRSKGKIPAMVYGQGIENSSIAVEEKELIALLRSNPNAIVQMDLPGQGNHPVMIAEMQRDSLLRSILHIDFHQINVKDKHKATVYLDVVGTPAGAKEGGILQTQKNELEIECLPQDIPSSIKVDVSQLNVGDSILVSDLDVGSNIEVLSDPKDVIVLVLAPQKELDEEEETAEVDETQEPELVEDNNEDKQ